MFGPGRGSKREMLETNDRKARRERLTMIRIFKQWQGLGYRGGDDAVRHYAAGWHRAHAMVTAATYVPLSFDPRYFIRHSLDPPGVTSR